mmetsp:Transcript_7680/g.22744  ORF Transcript_7680/g.22744 Transcript_7680/m.22744 type:complete len:88 (+) Transcript_7680:330-593(+)
MPGCDENACHGLRRPNEEDHNQQTKVNSLRVYSRTLMQGQQQHPRAAAALLMSYCSSNFFCRAHHKMPATAAKQPINGSHTVCINTG